MGCEVGGVLTFGLGVGRTKWPRGGLRVGGAFVGYQGRARWAEGGAVLTRCSQVSVTQAGAQVRLYPFPTPGHVGNLAAPGHVGMGAPRTQPPPPKPLAPTWSLGGWWWGPRPVGRAHSSAL